MGSNEGIIGVVKVTLGNGIARYDLGASGFVGGVAEGLCTGAGGRWEGAAGERTCLNSWAKKTLHSGAGPGGHTGPEEVLIFCPNSTFQLKAQGQGGPVFGISD
jgi:hypothetical protein